MKITLNIGPAYITVNEFWECDCNRQWLHHRELLECPKCHKKQENGSEALLVDLIRLNKIHELEL